MIEIFCSVIGLDFAGVSESGVKNENYFAILAILKSNPPAVFLTQVLLGSSLSGRSFANPDTLIRS